MYSLLSILSLLLISVSSWALVDTKSGNYKKTFVDFKVEGSVFPISLNRTYNSRSLYKGLFGVGWCSNLETKADVLPDNTVKVTECGGGQETIFISQQAVPNIQEQVNQIISTVSQQNKNLSRSYFTKLKEKLMKSRVLRNEFLRAYNIKGQIIEGKPYVAEGRSNDILIYDKRGWLRRVLPSGVDQIFQLSSGNLIQISDRSGNFIKIEWNKENQPQRLSNQKGRKIDFQYSTQGTIAKIVSSGKPLSQYRIDNENLVWVSNQDGVHTHRYDDLHNLIETTYPNEEGKVSKEKLTYDKRKDWVTSFTNKRDCVENYVYKTNTKNANHYWTDVKKMCGKTVTNVSRYEFWNRQKQDGAMYLHRARQDVNGEVRDITYHPQFKRATNVTQNGRRTQYSYYKNGLLQHRTGQDNRTWFTNYHKRCRKPIEIKLQSAQQNNQKSQFITQQTIDIEYNTSTCLMSKVARSDGRWVALSHDEKGRISEMKDQTGKTILVEYNDVVNKPQKIIHKGVGVIEMVYDKNGNSQGWKKGSDPLIMSQVMAVFNGLVELISPVRREISI